MKCCRKSTTCLVSVWLLAAVPVGGQGLAAEAPASPVARAIEAAVQRRMGGVRVVIETLQVQGATSVPDGVAARPDPNARIGRQVRFALVRCEGASLRCNDRVGTAVAVVTVGGSHARAARPIPRGTMLGEADLVDVDGDPGSVPLRPLPLAADLVGARALRDIEQGQPVAEPWVRPAPLVRSGETVTARVVLDGIVATARGVASQSGGRGALISLVNPESGRRLKGRVTGPREVEVVQ